MPAMTIILTIIINNSKRCFKNLENCERVVVFRKVGEQKITEIRIHLTSELNSILV